ncbi:MAG: hypothetical protein ACI8W8_004868 [Rhodothermales bacterium]|jgi:hypothetical protein
MGIRLICVLLSLASFAHDSEFSHSSRTLYCALSADTLTIEYRLMLPLDQAWIEMAAMDTDTDGEVSPEEKRVFLEQKATRLLGKIEVASASKPVALTLSDVAVDSGITQTFTFQALGVGPITLRDNNFVDRPGSVRVQRDAETRVDLQAGQDHRHVGQFTLRVSRSAN